MADRNEVPKEKANAPTVATDAVLMPSESIPEGSREVQGLDFNEYRDRKITVEELVNNMASMGFQASAIGEAVRIVNEMVRIFLIAQVKMLIFRSGLGETQRRTTRPPFSWDTLLT